MADYGIIHWLSVVPVLLAGLYTQWQWRNFHFWKKARAISVREAYLPLPTVALLVPYRNEAENLPQLLADIDAFAGKGNIRLSVFLIDDHSSDGGKQIVDEAAAAKGSVRIHSLALADHLNGRTVTAHKKEALAYAIGLTTADVIVTTDADCRLPATMTEDLVRRFQTGADVVLGPVLIAPPHNNLSGVFQAFDFAAYQLYTASCVRARKPTLANGACFAFRRQLFHDVGGYAGLDHLPSGDDVLLLHRFAQQPGVRFAWSDGPPVLTRAVPTWRGLWQQRIRWASKAGEYVSPALQHGQALAFLTALGILVAIALTPVSTIFLKAGLLAWLIKGVIDYILLADILRHYRQAYLLNRYLPVQLIYPFYLVAVGLGALLGAKTEWKGRGQ